MAVINIPVKKFTCQLKLQQTSKYYNYDYSNINSVLQFDYRLS